MKRTRTPIEAWALQIIVALVLLVFTAILFASTFTAAPQQDGFYPPLPSATGQSFAVDGPSVTPTPPATLCDFSQEFESVANLTAQGWIMQNNSQPVGSAPNWFQGNGAHFNGRLGSYIATDYRSGSGLATISNWLMTPPLTLQNNTQFRFWTQTDASPRYPDRLQVRMSTNGTSSDVGSTAVSVGDFSTLLLDINPTYTTNGYPTGWTQYSFTITGLPSSSTGRIAFRYFVENGGPNGANSEYIGIDGMQFFCAPSTPPPTPVPSASPCSCERFNVSGSISNCANPNRPRPASGITLNVDGSPSAVTDSNGEYAIHTTVFGFGGHTVTPSKPRLSPAATGINTVDVIATQRHFLSVTLLTGCGLTAGDVDQNGTIDTVDVIAIQRFYLGISAGTANVGTYRFAPSNLGYPGQNIIATGQNYDSLVDGDVAAPFVQ